MQGYEPKSDPRLRGGLKYFALVGAIGALGKLLLDRFWVPSSPADVAIYWGALVAFALLGEAIAERTWPGLAARLRERAAQRAIW
jgi:hypothetical protein